MKLSNSKKELARIISENGGWRNGAEWAAQDKGGKVFFYGIKPTPHPRVDGWGFQGVMEGYWIARENALPNWHQTILSRAEYFYLYPATGDDGWIEWKGGACPVDVGSVVDVRQSNGLTYKARAANFHWNLITGSSCVVAYRLHKQSEPEFCESVMRSIPGSDEQVWTNPPTIEQLAADYRNARA